MYIAINLTRFFELLCFTQPLKINMMNRLTSIKPEHGMTIFTLSITKFFSAYFPVFTIPSVLSFIDQYVTV